MEADVCLVELLLHVAVAVDADVAPRHRPRHVEIGRHVEARFVAAGEQVVEFVDVVGKGRGLCPRTPGGATGIRLRPHAVVVVDADGVVAAAHESLHEAVGHVVIRVVGGEAEVDAIEALLHAWQAFELEVSANGLEPAVPSGGGVLEAHAGEVERAAGNHVLLVVEAHPVFVFGDRERFVV